MNSDGSIKIFVDAHVFDGEFQGTRTFIKGIYSILAEKSDLQIFLAAHDIENLRSEFAKNEKIVFIQYKTRSSLTRLLYEIPSILRKYEIHYAHFQYISPFIKRCRYIVTIHDLLFMEYPREFPLLYRLTRSIIFKRSTATADIV